MEELIESWLGPNVTVFHKDLFGIKMTDCTRKVMVVVGAGMAKLGWYEWTGRGPFLLERPANFAFGANITVVLSSAPLLNETSPMPRAMQLAINASVAEYFYSALLHNQSAFFGEVLPYLAQEIRTAFGQQRALPVNFRPFLKIFRAARPDYVCIGHPELDREEMVSDAESDLESEDESNLNIQGMDVEIDRPEDPELANVAPSAALQSIVAPQAAPQVIVVPPPIKSRASTRRDQPGRCPRPKTRAAIQHRRYA